MLKKIFRLMLVGSQIGLVGLFFTMSLNENTDSLKYVSIIHNENLNKIANSVTLLFEEEIIPKYEEESDVLSELPSAEVDSVVEETESEIDKEEFISIPLVSVDASKYRDKESSGFKVTENNKNYTLSDYEFDVVVAVVAGEYGGDLNDALAVVSVILNRCDSKTWSSWIGSNPYKQVIANGQFEVYLKDYYMAYMPGGSGYGGTKYEVAKQAVIDGLNGIRNNGYLGFRAWYLSNYSDKYVTAGGNRYGYN